MLVWSFFGTPNFKCYFLQKLHWFRTAKGIGGYVQPVPDKFKIKAILNKVFCKLRDILYEKIYSTALFRIIKQQNWYVNYKLSIIKILIYGGTTGMYQGFYTN